MDRGTFWNLVERVRLCAEAEFRDLRVLQRAISYPEVLTWELEPLGPAELESFQDHLQFTVAEAYTSGLYAVHCVVNGGVSLDGFYYFRAWLVFQGRQIHQGAITDPDSLAEVCTARGIVADYECEDVLNVAKGLYQERTGEIMACRSDPGDVGLAMPGERWADRDLPRLLPRLASIHTER
jgi:hypothetical protein